MADARTAIGAQYALSCESRDAVDALVARAIIRVVTAGTLTEESLLEPRRANVLAAVCDVRGTCGIAAVDGIVFDIGVSSMQIDREERGFSFQKDGPLDMRMAQEGESAAEWLNRADESEIADVLYHYGDERQSRRVARAIVAARPLTRTAELATVIRKALRHPPGAPGPTLPECIAG